MSNKIKCSHILVDKHSEALQLLDEIKKGKNLVQLLEKFLNVQVEKKMATWDILQKE